MSEIKIELLTAVHIGSGETLQYGNDFVKGSISENGEKTSVLGIVDTQKVMKLIGVENIGNWVNAIEKKTSIDRIVSVYAPNAKIEDYSGRIILRWSQVRETDTLKEHIHNGMGRPYIPGSSIKGAIRTAILASVALSVDNQQLEYKIRDGNNRINADQIEDSFFGKEPNSDVFRFLQVGDAYFGDDYEIAVRMVNINERKKQSFWDTSKPQLIEALCPGDESSFQMKLNMESYRFSKEKVNRLPECMHSIADIFQTINAHTKLLVGQEIDYWSDCKDDDESGKVDAYLEKMMEMLAHIQECKSGKSCVLRLGHGSGWRFITGAWAENMANFNSVIVPASRPNNKYYEDYTFPKTRRVDDTCELLGFVKLSQE